MLVQAQRQRQAAEEQARANLAAQAEAAARQQKQDEQRIQQAIAAEKAAVEEARIEKAQREAIARKKAQDEIARRVAKLNNDTQDLYGKPPGKMAAAAVPLSAKELKLAELLRRYQADQITPLEYHSERAKIIAEP